MPHKTLQSPLLSLPAEILTLVFSYWGCEEMQCFLEALPRNSPVFRLFELFVVNEEPTFYFTRPELCPQSIERASKAGRRALVTLFEFVTIGRKNEPCREWMNGVLKNHSTTFIAMNDGKNTGGYYEITTPNKVLSKLLENIALEFPKASFVHLNGHTVVIYLSHIVDPSRIHIKDCRRLMLYEGSFHSSSLRLDNISMLRYEATPKCIEKFDFTREPREELHLSSLIPYEIVDTTIISSPLVHLFNCKRFENIVLPNAMIIQLTFPTYPTKMWRPAIKRIIAPKLEKLNFSSLGDFGDFKPIVEDIGDTSDVQIRTYYSSGCGIRTR